MGAIHDAGMSSQLARFLDLDAFLQANRSPILSAPGHQAHRNASRDTCRLIRIVEKDIRALPHNSITPSTELTGAATRFGAGLFIVATASTLVTLHSAVGRDAHGELVRLPSKLIGASAAHEHAFFVSPRKIASISLVVDRLVASHVEKEGFVTAKKATMATRATSTTSDALAATSTSAETGNSSQRRRA